MDSLIDLVRREIRRALVQVTWADIGRVTAIDWPRQMARVRLSSNGQESGWLRISAEYVGSVAPLRSGEEVLVTFLDGRTGGHGIITRRLYGRPPDLPENSFGAVQGQAKILFDSQGRVVWESVSSVSVSAQGSISLDGSSVILGSGSSAAVKHEELAAALNPWCLAVQTAFQALGVTLPLPDFTAARSAKVSLS